MRLVVRLLTAFALMVALLWATALLGGVGTVELSIWTVLLVVALVVVVVRSRRHASSSGPIASRLDARPALGGRAGRCAASA